MNRSIFIIEFNNGKRTCDQKLLYCITLRRLNERFDFGLIYEASM